jgi:hypothetical protein
VRVGLSLAIISAAAFYVVAYRLGEAGVGFPAFDVYGYFYPNMLYALRSLAAGHGLLWNPFSNCGQPFFAISSVGLLYPGNLFFLVLSPPLALRALLFANLAVGGVGVWALGHEIGLGQAAALGGALAFTLGSTTLALTLWTPTVQGPYVWMPWALLLCERLLRTGRLRDGVWLGIVFTLALLPGHPQFALLGCALVGGRLLWGLGDATERRRLPRAAGGVALAVVVMLLLTAVQLLPALEVAAQSIRGRPLAAPDIGGALTWKNLSRSIRLNTTQAPFSIVPGLVVAAALANRSKRRTALFYALASGLFLLLAFGPATPIGRLYLATPLGRAFRMPMRFMYVTGFCFSVLTGIATDALLGGSWVAVGALGAALVGCRLWSGPLSASHWGLAGSIVAGGALAAAFPLQRAAARVLVVGAVALAPLLLPMLTMQRYFWTDDPLWRNAAVFDGLRARLTSQARVYLAHPPLDLGFQEKTAMLFGVHAVTDYEGQVARTYAEFLTMMRTGQLVRSVNQVIYPGPWNAMAVRWPLLNLAAARYLAVAPKLDVPSHPGSPPLIPFDGDPGIHTYENPTALPRAYYVPRVAVVADSDARLTRLAAGVDDPRQVALVETLPPSGFVGTLASKNAPARIIVDEPEHVAVELDAPARGFLFLADQYFPGWSATVHGESTPILRANHTFRLVEVPKGPVRVDFRYRPASVRLGASISAVTLVVVILVLLRTRTPHPPVDVGQSA